MTSRTQPCSLCRTNAGQRILIVDEVDDTRKTLSFAVSELQKDIDAQEADYASKKTASDPEFQAPKLGVFVVRTVSQFDQQLFTNLLFDLHTTQADFCALT